MRASSTASAESCRPQSSPSESSSLKTRASYPQEPCHAISKTVGLLSVATHLRMRHVPQCALLAESLYLYQKFGKGRCISTMADPRQCETRYQSYGQTVLQCQDRMAVSLGIVMNDQQKQFDMTSPAPFRGLYSSSSIAFQSPFSMKSSTDEKRPRKRYIFGISFKSNQSMSHR